MTSGRKSSAPPRRRSTRTKVLPTPLADAAAPRAASASADRLLTLSEAAFRLGRVHRTTVMRWVKEGGLRCVRLSRKAILFEPAELERFIRDHRSSG
jgi:excisionase family DNA binding protein